MVDTRTDLYDQSMAMATTPIYLSTCVRSCLIRKIYVWHANVQLCDCARSLSRGLKRPRIEEIVNRSRADWHCGAVPARHHTLRVQHQIHGPKVTQRSQITVSQYRIRV